MAERTLPVIDGAYVPESRTPADLAQRYKIKYSFYFFSGFLFLVGTTIVLFLYDLSRDGIYPAGLVVDETILSFYLLYLFLIGIALRARAGFCVVCGKFRFPVLGIDSFCHRCGAHLFRHSVFTEQEIARAARDLDPGDRLIEMAGKGDTDAVHNLIGKGVDVNHVDRYGNTALMIAAKNNRLDVLNLLLMAAADPYKTNKYGLNALMLAVDRDQKEAVMRLLETGLSVTQTSNDGRNALDIARGHNNEELIEILSGYPGP